MEKIAFVVNRFFLFFRCMIKTAERLLICAFSSSRKMDLEMVAQELECLKSKHPETYTKKVMDKLKSMSSQERRILWQEALIDDLQNGWKKMTPEAKRGLFFVVPGEKEKILSEEEEKVVSDVLLKSLGCYLTANYTKSHKDIAESNTLFRDDNLVWRLICEYLKVQHVWLQEMLDASFFEALKTISIKTEANVMQLFFQKASDTSKMPKLLQDLLKQMSVQGKSYLSADSLEGQKKIDQIVLFSLFVHVWWPVLLLPDAWGLEGYAVDQRGTQSSRIIAFVNNTKTKVKEMTFAGAEGMKQKLFY